MNGMKAFLSKPVFKKNGKRFIIIYLCWCLIKGIVIVFAGMKLFS